MSRRRPAARLVLSAAASLALGACAVPTTAPDAPARVAIPRLDESAQPAAPKDSTRTPTDSTRAGSGYQNPVA